MGGAGNLIPIGRFSQICRLTIKAPRYYGLGQVAVADRIRALREIDMPLEEIAAALREHDPAAISARLTVHQRRLEQHAALESALAALLGMLEPGDDARYAMRVVTVPERSVVEFGAVAPPTELSRATSGRRSWRCGGGTGRSWRGSCARWPSATRRLPCIRSGGSGWRWRKWWWIPRAVWYMARGICVFGGGGRMRI